MDKNEKLFLLAVGVAVYNIAARLANRCENPAEADILQASAVGIYVTRKILDPDGSLVTEVAAMVDVEMQRQDQEEQEQEQRQDDDTDEVEDPTSKLN